MSCCYNYVVTAHKPTAVSHSLVGNFTAPNELNLIVAKNSRLEISLITPEGLQPRLDVPIYGRIAALELFRPPGEVQDLLLLVTERHKLAVLAYDPASGEALVTRAHGDVSDKIARPVENGMLVAIDPDCRCVVLHLYDAHLKIIPVDARGALREAFNLRLEELQVLDIKMLYGCARPTAAVLYEDAKGARHIKAYEIALKDKELRDGGWQVPNLDPGSGIIIPVPPPLGGALIVGEATVVYVNDHTQKAALKRCAVTRCYGRVDADGSRYLLGDDAGVLSLLVLVHSGGGVTDLKVEVLGETSVASTLSYLDNGVVYVGSSGGDSQLIKLTGTTPGPNGSYVELLESFVNLAPIVDFAVVDLERQGQGQVVTCSGTGKDGSLRVVRNGVGINEQASVELPGIKGFWSLRSSSAAIHDKYLVVSFIRETRVLEISDADELDETTLPGFDPAAQTLLAANVDGDQLVQATPAGLRLVAADGRGAPSLWSPPAGTTITCAAATATQVMVATSGGRLTLLAVPPRGAPLVTGATLLVGAEVACLDMSPLVSLTGATSSRSTVAVAGLWSIEAILVALPGMGAPAAGFSVLSREALGGEVIPRSVLLASFEGHPYLLCALGDGHLSNWAIDAATGALSDRKTLSLGTTPIALRAFRSKGAVHVFAASDRPTVIYASGRKLLYSNVNLREVALMCPFNSSSFPDSLAIAAGPNLTIGTIDDIQKLHIRTVPLGEQPRRIAHQESSRTFAVLTCKPTGSGGAAVDDEEHHRVRLVDDSTFESLDAYDLEPNEHATALISCAFGDAAAAADAAESAPGAAAGPASAPTPMAIASGGAAAGSSPQYYVVGTAYALPDEVEPTKGRLLVLHAVDGKLTLVAEKEAKGAVYALAAFHGRLVATINAKVALYKWAAREDGSRDLQSEASLHGSVLALYLATRGDFILVGDLMKSVSLLMWKPEEGVLEERARDYNANWTTAVAMLDDEVYLGAENSFNLFTVRRNSEATTDEERGKLEVVGEYHLGELVNRFRHGSLVMQLPDEAGGGQVPTVLFGTVGGVIGVIASLPRESFHFLQRLQSALAKAVPGAGNMSHDAYRAFSNERKTAESANFIDGDLVESFLDLPRHRMEAVATAVGVPLEQLTRRVEELTRLH